MRRRLFILHLPCQPRLARPPAPAEWSACGQCHGAKCANGWYLLTGRSLVGNEVSSTLRGHPTVWFRFHLTSGYAGHLFSRLSCLLSCIMTSYDLGFDRELVLSVLERLERSRRI